MNFLFAYFMLDSFITSSFVKLISYNEQPVSQFLLSDKTTQFVITGTKSFFYKTNSIDYKPTVFNNSPFLSTEESVQIKQLKDGTIAIACNSIGVTLHIESGKEISRYNLNVYDRNIKCSFLELNVSRFMLIYYFNSEYQIDFLKLDESTNILIKEANEIAIPASVSPESFISCELFELNITVFCIYVTNKTVEGLYFKTDDQMQRRSIAIDADYDDEMKLIKISDNVIGLFILQESYIKGCNYQYQPDSEEIVKQNEGKVLTYRDVEYDVFDIQSFERLNQFAQIISLIIAIGCNKTICLLSKYSVDFEELIPITKLLIDLENSSSKVKVSLSSFNEFILSIIVTQNKENYISQLNINYCLNTVSVYHTTNAFFFKTISSHSSSVQIIILETTPDFLNYLSLHSSLDVITKDVKYALSPLKFTPAKGGNYHMTYQLFDLSVTLNLTCTILFHICYKGCKTCFEYGNEMHMGCLECEDGYYSSESNPSQCNEITRRECDALNPYWIETKRKCVSSCKINNLYTDSDNYLCLSECPKDKMLNKIENKCLKRDEFNRNMDKYIKDMDKYVLDLHTHFPKQRTDNYTMKIYDTSTIPKEYSIDPVSFDDTDYNVTYLSTINLEHCEEILKDKYNINPQSPLIIAQFDSVVSSQISSNVQYSVYSSNGTTLDLNICKETPIVIVTPIIDRLNKAITLSQDYMKKGINLFDAQDPFFTDICFPYSTLEKTDIPLNIRLKEYYLNKEILCNSGCQFQFVDYEKSFVVCSCLNESNDSYEFHYSLLMNQSLSFFEQTNLGVMKCSKLLFQSTFFVLNFGGFILLTFLTLQFINTLYFWILGIGLIKQSLLTQKSHIKQKVWNKMINNSKSPLITNNTKPKHKEKNGLGKNKSLVEINNNNRNQEFKDLQDNSLMRMSNNRKRENSKLFLVSKQKLCLKQTKPNERIIHEQRLKKRANIPQVHKSFQENSYIIFPHFLINIENRKNCFSDQSPSTTNNMIQHQCHLLKLIDLPYQNEKLTFSFLYCSFLINIQPIIKTFFLKNKNKTRIVKLSAFVLFLSLTITFNTLLFSVKYVSFFYYSHGKFNFGLFFPRILLSFCIGMIFRLLINYVSSPLAVIYEFKKNKKQYSLKHKCYLIRNMNQRLIQYYCLLWFMSIFSFYYVSVFCAVYPNLQLILIVSSAICFIIEQVFPLLISPLLSLLCLLNTRYQSQAIKLLTFGLAMIC